MKLRVLAIVLLCAFLAFMAWKGSSGSLDGAENTASAKAGNQQHPSTDIVPGSGEFTGKSLVRPEQQEVTMEMTLEQLRKPLGVDVSYPRQSVRERIVAINASLREAEIPARLLRIRVNETYSRKEDVLALMAGEIRLKHPDPAEILKYTCESVMLDYRVEAGVVVLKTDVENE